MSLDEKEKSQRAIGQLEMPELFGRVPWGHHIDNISQEFGYKDAGKRMDLLYIDVKLEKKIP